MKHSNNIYTDLFKLSHGVDVKDIVFKFHLIYMPFDNGIVRNIRINPVLEKRYRKFDITVTSLDSIYEDGEVKTFRTSFFQLKNYLKSLLMNGIIISEYQTRHSLYYNFDLPTVMKPIIYSKINNVDKIKLKMGLHILAEFDTYYHQGITLNILKSLIPTLKKYLIIKYKNTSVVPPWNFLINHLDTELISPKNKDSFPFDFVINPSWT